MYIYTYTYSPIRIYIHTRIALYVYILTCVALYVYIHTRIALYVYAIPVNIVLSPADGLFAARCDTSVLPYRQQFVHVINNMMSFKSISSRMSNIIDSGWSVQFDHCSIVPQSVGNYL
jgi:hypothetical protein